MTEQTDGRTDIWLYVYVRERNDYILCFFLQHCPQRMLSHTLCVMFFLLWMHIEIQCCMCNCIWLEPWLTVHGYAVRLCLCVCACVSVTVWFTFLNFTQIFLFCFFFLLSPPVIVIRCQFPVIAWVVSLMGLFFLFFFCFFRSFAELINTYIHLICLEYNFNILSWVCFDSEVRLSGLYDFRCRQTSIFCLR